MNTMQYLLLEASTRVDVVTINIISNNTIEVVTRDLHTELLDYELIHWKEVQSIIKEIEDITHMKIYEIVTIYNNEGNSYCGISKPLSNILYDLQNGYVAIPF